MCIINVELFKRIPEMVRLYIFQYLNNGPFIVSYHKIKKCLYICVDKNYPIITRVLDYKQLNPPKYNYRRLPFYTSLCIKINLHGKAIFKENFTYNSSNIIISYSIDYDLDTLKLIDEFKRIKSNKEEKKDMIKILEYLKIKKLYSINSLENAISRLNL